MIDKIKDKIIDLVPDAMDFIGYCPNPDCGAGIMSEITLAVVLRAIQKTEYQSFLNLYLESDKMMLTSRGEMAYWNLAKDYDDQTEETKTFIGTLLGVTK